MGVRDGTGWVPFRQPRLDEAEVYDVLDNERRRRALLHLRRRAGETDLGDLADAVARLETPERPVPSDCRESVYNALHQTHLPKLEGLDVVDYDRETKTVRLQHSAQVLDRHLDWGGSTVSWAECYQLLGVGSLLAVLFVELDLLFLSAVETLPAVTAALLALAGVGLYQLWSRRWLYLRSLGF
jgi:hypothetical protein